MVTTDTRRAPDLYQLLHVRPTDDDRTLTAAYRRLARRYHPDVDPRPQALRRMIAINQAFAVLRDPERRAAYDRSLRTGSAQGWEPGSRPAAGRAAASSADTPEVVILPFGRYEGWTIERVARVDRGYLEWLERAPAGRQYRDAISAALTR